jgi:hypothetical protein
MYNELENANLYFEIISSIYSEKTKLDKNKNLIIALASLASIDSLEKFSKLKTKNKALVKLAMGNEGLEKFDNFADTIIKQAQLSGALSGASRGVGAFGTLGTLVGDIIDRREKNKEQGLTGPWSQFSGAQKDFLWAFFSYVPIVGGGLATYDIIAEMRKENPSYFKIAISSFILIADAAFLYSLVTRDKKTLPIGFAGKFLGAILIKIRKGLQITKVEQAALNKLGPSLIGIIDKMNPKIAKIVDKLPISAEKKLDMKAALPVEFDILKQKINTRMTVGNLTTNEILRTLDSKFQAITKGSEKIYRTNHPQAEFIHVTGDTFLHPSRYANNGTVTEFNLVKLENAIHNGTEGVKIVRDSSVKAPNSMVAKSQAALDMMTNKDWRNTTDLRIDASLLPESLKKFLGIKNPTASGGAVAGATTLGAGMTLGVGVAAGQGVGNTIGSLAGRAVETVTPKGGVAVGGTEDAPGSY